MRRSVVYFDDDTSQLDIFREMFGAEYDVTVAAALADARRAIAEGRPEIVISDQLMPEISGTDFLREAARLRPRSFRIMLTGAISVADVLAEMRDGLIHLFLTKPWTERQVRDALERAEAFLSAPRTPPPGKGRNTTGY